MGYFKLVFALLLTLAATSGIYAAEEMLRYDSDITVRPDGVLEIVETITVRAEGKAIRRGILRDFPTRYKDRLGNDISVGFRVTSVKRDGSAEAFTVVDYDNGKRVRIGRREVFLTPGSYQYRIAYETTHQISHLAEMDELYYNAIGTGWDFPILAGKITVNVPAGAEIGRATAYTGAMGARDTDFSLERLSNTSVRYDLTKRLRSREGMTIVVEWPKGFVKQPTATDKAERFLGDNGWAYVAGIGLIILFVYLYGAWRFIGKDPLSGAIIARYDPPKGPFGRMSPALCRFVLNMKSDETMFTTAIISMASKGYLNIIENDGSITIVETGKTASLSVGERVIARRLFAGVKSYAFGEEYDERLASCIRKFSSAVTRGESKYFRNNQGPALLGLSIWIGGQ